MARHGFRKCAGLIAFQYIMENRLPIIGKGDLIAGTTTSKAVGALPYVDAAGTYLWPELFTVPHRMLFPYDISPEDAWTLHHEVFPYWIDKNFRERVRRKHNDPLSQKIDERFAVYFSFKSSAFSHIIPDFPAILRLGTSGVIAQIRKDMEQDPETHERNTVREAMIVALDGLAYYSHNLAAQAETEAQIRARTLTVRKS